MDSGKARVTNSPKGIAVCSIAQIRNKGVGARPDLEIEFLRSSRPDLRQTNSIARRSGLGSNCYNSIFCLAAVWFSAGDEQSWA